MIDYRRFNAQNEMKDLDEKDTEMRDVSQIDGFMNSLRELWKTHAPDMRFGQLMVSFDAWHERHYRKDIFYLEEDELLMRIKEFLGPDRANQQRKRA